MEDILTDKARLSLYKKSLNSGYSTGILEEVYCRGYFGWDESFDISPEQLGFDRVNSFIAGGFAAQLDEDLRKWFDPKDPEGGWKRINSKGEAIGPCAREKGEPKPKCMSNEKRSKLSKKERAAAVAAKRKHDPVADRSGKGGKPINVSNFGKGKVSEEYSPLLISLEENNTPTNPSLWSKAKSLARSKFDVYPSAYANGWAAKWYKSKGGGWKSTNEEYTGAEKTSSDMTKPSSRFIGTPNLTKVYKDMTPEYSKTLKTVKKVVREQLDEVAAWQRKEGKDPKGGLNRKGVESYRREHPGSKLKTAVTTEPSKLEPGSKAAKRRKSFCARMSGMKKRLTSAKTAHDPDSRINKSLRKWNCEETQVNELNVPLGTTGKRGNVSTPMVAIRMASGKIEKHPPGKSGSSGGGGDEE